MTQLLLYWLNKKCIPQIDSDVKEEFEEDFTIDELEKRVMWLCPGPDGLMVIFYRHFQLSSSISKNGVFETRYHNTPKPERKL